MSILFTIIMIIKRSMGKLNYLLKYKHILKVLHTHNFHYVRLVYVHMYIIS